MGYVHFRCQEKTDAGSPDRIAGKPGWICLVHEFLTWNSRSKWARADGPTL